MKLKGLFSVILFIGITVISVIPGNFAAVQANAPADALNTVLANVETTSRQMTGLQATVSHQRTNGQLNIKDPKQVGTLLYKPGSVRRMRIDYTQPQPKVVAVNGDKGLLFERSLNQVFLSTVSKVASKAGSSGILSILNSAAQLKEKFDIKLVGNEGFNGMQTTHLTLTPKAQDGFTRIEVWIDNKTWLPVRQIFYERNRDFTEVTLSNIVFNPKLSDKQFDVDYGKAKVIKG